MKILIFLQGTLIVHGSAAGKTREEIIKQVVVQDDSVRDFENYIPVGKAAQKLQGWSAQGTEISYLSALTENKKARGDELVGQEGLRAEENVLRKYGFPTGNIYHRERNEDYKDVIERISPLPDILIEDDCESIGGEKEMTYPSLNSEIKDKIRSIVVKEFSGIDRLPDNILLLSKQEQGR